jgi:polyisoprenoid-binding protein YceI
MAVFKKYLSLFFIIILYSQAYGQEIDINNSYIKFDSKYLQNALIEGIITGIKGKVEISQTNIQSSDVDISIDITTINTGYEKRDLALLGHDILDTTHYPLIHFKSLRFDQNSSGYRITGNLKIKETTRQIEFPFTITQVPKKIVINGRTKIDRFDYLIGENISTITASRDINIFINLVLKIPEHNEVPN